MKHLKVIISWILILSICFTCVIGSCFAAGTASGRELIRDTPSYDAWLSWYDVYGGSLFNSVFGGITKQLFFSCLDGAFAKLGVGSCASLETLAHIASNWWVSCQFGPIATLTVAAETLGMGAVVEYDSELGVFRLMEKKTKLWIVNTSGLFPYYKPADDPGAEAPDITQQLSYQWLRTNQINWNGGIAIVSYMELKEILALGYDGYIERRGNYLHIFDRSTDGTQILCSEEGFPLSAISDMSNTAVGTPNNYYTEEGDTINNYDQGDTIYNEFLDITNNTTWFPNGTLQYIDKVVYDESTKTYIVDSHDSYTYNSTTNTYVTNNYRYEYNYHIDYTSVTYIGTTEQYDEEYRYYYQLPDGRSSADLTAEDLEQLSIAFTDVVNYARSADDANMRVLYHFDGNTQDSSYWSYCTDFKWNSGASLTYMDEGTFGGSLYLDETEHDFTITLPNALDGANDYTFQFRYYQSYTAAPQKDSYINLGDTVVLRMDGASWYNSSGTALASTSIGNWNEICLIYSGSTLYYYINGVPYGTTSVGLFTSGTITFHFGSSQQTYKKLDELRFTRGAVYTPGENYECSSVPFDTNLTMILPDGERPMADEIVSIVSENNMLSSYGLDDWANSDVLNNLTLFPVSSFSGGYAYSYYDDYMDGVYLFYNPDYTSVSFDQSALISCSSLSYTYERYKRKANTSGAYNYEYIHDLASSLVLPTGCSSEKGQGNLSYTGINSCFTDGSYCLSIVHADGSLSYCVFTLGSGGKVTISSQSSDVLNFGANYCFNNFLGSTGTTYYSYLYGLHIMPKSINTAVDIAYMELVEGTEPQYSYKYETAMYSSGELEESPVLAVRSNQTITGYQIGGVRPSYPAKGQVWAMVENGRITSLQQYTGSAWVEVDGRIWTGQRWIPYSSFDVFLLKDCFDIQGTVSDPDYEYIYSESGFWAWFQRQWLAFMAKIDQILDAVQKTSGTGGSELENVEVFPDAADPDGDGSSWGIVDLLVSVKDGVWHFVTGVVSAGFDGFTEFTVSIVRIGDLFDSFDEDNENGIFIPVEEGGSVWD